MRDSFFYFLAILIVAALVGAALWPARHNSGPTDAEIISGGFVLEGANLQKMVAAKGTVMTYVAQGDGAPYVQLSSDIPRDIAPPSAGVFSLLGSQYEKLFGGQVLKMTISARARGPHALEQFESGYFTAGNGDSGWFRFQLTDEFKDYGFLFSPAKPSGAPSSDYFGIWPGVDGKNEQMQVRRMRIEIVPPPQ